MWIEECQIAFDQLKEKLISTPILIFPYGKKTFHVHVDASSVALRTVLVQLREGEIDHPVTFSSRKLSDVEKTYTTIENEGLDMA